MVAFMHAIIDQTANYFAGMIYTPADAIWSFGAGIHGMLVLAGVVLLLLRDPVWKDAPVKAAQLEPALHTRS
ncbi:MAG: hypothetical protein PHQ40_15325 [Anaerolineaceae bacterium]|nr:hypothetical protein [Anaerolineaceae bacterium]